VSQVKVQAEIAESHLRSFSPPSAFIPLTKSAYVTETVCPSDETIQRNLPPEDVALLKELFELLARWEEIGNE
jgi:hypothetical protein